MFLGDRMSYKKPEVLSPVGSEEMLIAAVRSGADAVYLGLDSFNARRNAKNFTIDSLKEAVAFCHVRGVKVYLTLNINIGDKEMRQAISKTVEAASVGIEPINFNDAEKADTAVDYSKLQYKFQYPI